MITIRKKLTNQITLQSNVCVAKKGMLKEPAFPKITVVDTERRVMFVTVAGMKFTNVENETQTVFHVT